MPRRDRATERSPKASRERYANLPEAIESDRVALTSETGREETGEDRPQDFVDEVAAHPPGTQPKSDVTSKHDDGDETVDGLDATEEAVRRYAEDRPVGGKREHR